MLAFPTAALASPEAVILDCAQDGDLDKTYSSSDLQGALDSLPTDLDEYTGCREVINGGKTGTHSGPGPEVPGATGGTGGSPGGTAAGTGAELQPTAADQAALAQFRADAVKPGSPPEISIGGEQLKPGDNGLFSLASAANQLPDPMVLALLSIGLLLIGAGGFAAGRLTAAPMTGGIRGRLARLRSQ